MSGWNVLRAATEDDFENLRLAAVGFAARRGWEDDQGMGVMNAISIGIDTIRLIDPIEGARVDRLWVRCVRRALDSQVATGIRWGSVGYDVPRGRSG